MVRLEPRDVVGGKHGPQVRREGPQELVPGAHAARDVDRAEVDHVKIEEGELGPPRLGRVTPPPLPHDLEERVHGDQARDRVERLTHDVPPGVQADEQLDDDRAGISRMQPAGEDADEALLPARGHDVTLVGHRPVLGAVEKAKEVPLRDLDVIRVRERREVPAAVVIGGGVGLGLQHLKALLVHEQGRVGVSPHPERTGGGRKRVQNLREHPRGALVLTGADVRRHDDPFPRRVIPEPVGCPGGRDAAAPYHTASRESRPAPRHRHQRRHQRRRLGLASVSFVRRRTALIEMRATGEHCYKLFDSRWPSLGRRRMRHRRLTSHRESSPSHARRRR